MAAETGSERATFLAMEAAARQRYDRALAAWRGSRADFSPNLATELDLSRREWEAARARLSAFRLDHQG